VKQSDIVSSFPVISCCGQIIVDGKLCDLGPCKFQELSSMTNRKFDCNIKRFCGQDKSSCRICFIFLRVLTNCLFNITCFNCIHFISIPNFYLAFLVFFKNNSLEFSSSFFHNSTFLEIIDTDHYRTTNKKL
jgi:hypothetical protein